MYNIKLKAKNCLIMHFGSKKNPKGSVRIHLITQEKG